MKFRKKPVIIEAIQWDGKMETMVSISQMSVDREVSSLGGGLLSIGTLEGDMTANLGDWIIKGVKGEIYPIKNDIFLLTYDEVLDD